MITVAVVLEAWPVPDFTAWPVSELSGYQFLPLSASMTDLEVATAVAVILDYNGIELDAGTTLDGALLDRHLVEAEALNAPGGLLFRDTITNAEFPPGCCVGLESWREWQDVIDGHSIFLGHSPDPRLEHRDGHVLLWHDGRDESPTPTLRISLAELPALLATSRRHLQGFLDLTQAWAETTAPQLAARLTSALDEYLNINTPSAQRTP